MDKRLLDIVVSLVLLIMLAPLLLVVAAIVFASSPGPVLFVQQRVGLGGKCFPFLKFRTMFASIAPELQRQASTLASEGILLKVEADPRVTPIGSMLRRYSLDELPQLINVLRGEMSMVGPRPLIPFMLEHEPEIAARRSKVKPGLTGIWQIEARDQSSSVRQMWQYDEAYIKQVSVLRDMSILLRTIPAVLRGTGAK